MKATKIRMKNGCGNSNSAVGIADIYIEGCDKPGFYDKGVLHDHVTKTPGSIQVGIPPYPNLVPAMSSGKEKYVRSEPNDTTHDNLLKLPRS